MGVAGGPAPRSSRPRRRAAGRRDRRGTPAQRGGCAAGHPRPAKPRPTRSRRSQIAQAALKQRLPAVYDRADFVEEGGLASYGVNLPDLSRRAAEYVDQIFKGKKPGELTLVQPTKFDLALNLKTAKQIGVAIPPDVLAKATKVIR